MALKRSNLPNYPGKASSEIHEVHENQTLQIRQLKKILTEAEPFWPEKRRNRREFVANNSTLTAVIPSRTSD